MSTPLTGDALVQDNQARAAALGVNIPGVGGAITSTHLQPQTPYDVTTPPPASTNPLTVANNAHAADITNDATPPPNPAKDELATMLKGIEGDISGEAGQEDQVRQQQDLYAKQQKATAASNQLDQLDKGYRDQVASIKKNSQGMFGTGIDQKLAEAQDTYENTRANLALTYKVLSGDANAAQQIVDDKVSSLERVNAQKLQAYQLAASAVNNDLTDSEKLTVQANLQQKADAAKVVTDTYSSVLANAAQNGAPASVLTAIDEAAKAPNASAASVIAAAGRYGTDALKAAQIANEQRLANGGGSGGGTAAERAAAAVSSLQSLISSGHPLTDGTPVVDGNGFITPTAWKKIIAEAPSEGLSRSEFIKEFGYLLYSDPKSGIPSSYQITPAEQKLISGALPS